MSVGTAASASLRDGFGTIGLVVARTCSDMTGFSAGEDLGQGLTTASIAVSPFDRPSRAGGVTGAAASAIRAWRDSTHAQQPDAAFPFYMASTSASLRREAPAGSKGSFSRRRNAPYIFLHWAGAIGLPASKHCRTPC